jgi:hypothetical protein
VYLTPSTITRISALPLAEMLSFDWANKMVEKNKAAKNVNVFFMLFRFYNDVNSNVVPFHKKTTIMKS